LYSSGRGRFAAVAAALSLLLCMRPGPTPAAELRKGWLELLQQFWVPSGKLAHTRI
jgi:hypothetical protein